MTQSNDKIKGPVRASKHTPIYVLDADGSFLFPVYDRAERDEIIHKHNGYGVAVDALREIYSDRHDASLTHGLFAYRILKELGELDGNDRDTNQALRRNNETSSQKDNTSSDRGGETRSDVGGVSNNTKQDAVGSVRAFDSCDDLGDDGVDTCAKALLNNPIDHATEKREDKARETNEAMQEANKEATNGQS